MTIADSLLLLSNTKAAIKSAIEAKGVTVGTAAFSTYPSKIAAILTGGGGTGEYVRPSDWLTMPVLTATDNKFVGLHAVFPDANYVALSAAGAYTVDWGDGTVENIATGVTAQHEYNYATYDAGNTTLCTRGYKQAIVTVTPKAGQSFTSISLQLRHSALLVGSATGWLDVTVSGASLSTIQIGGTVVLHTALEIFSCIKNAVTSSINMLGSCSALASIPMLYTAECTNFINMFANCMSLRTVPQLDTSQGTNLSNMFTGCSALQNVPTLDTSKATVIGTMFSGCSSLRSSPVTATPLATSALQMFSNCQSLTSVPALNLSFITASPTAIFSNCYALRKISAYGMAQSFGVGNAPLTAARLNEIFGNLATVTGKTITITNCPGAATCDRTIATSKGWTVSG